MMTSTLDNKVWQWRISKKQHWNKGFKAIWHDSANANINQYNWKQAMHINDSVAEFTQMIQTSKTEYSRLIAA